MYRVNHRISAFSLIEMLVVMVISSIMVGIIYFVYYTVNSYQVSISRKYDAIERINSFNSVLLNDFDKSEYIEAAGSNDFKCHIKHTGAEIYYSVFPDYVKRVQESRTDTLVCRVNSSTFLWNGKSETKGIIDEVQIETLTFGRIMKLVFFKEYDAAVLSRNTQPDLP